ncbi:TAF domain-containing protein [Aphelenchoides besseyi]|nr:TAF domain-containing protein [Aphelenchoides besseyi]
MVNEVVSSVKLQILIATSDYSTVCFKVEEVVKINKWDGNTTKYALDDSIRKVCAVCCVSYFILISILQLYMMYIEKNIFFQAVEHTKVGDRVWSFSGEMQRYDDKYTLTISYYRGSSSGSANVTKSISTYVTEDGEILYPMLKRETIAEGRGILNLDVEHAAKIAGTVNTACRTVMRIAARFQRAGRRRTMIPEDVDNAIRSMGLTPSFSYESKRPNLRYAGPLFKNAQIKDDREVELEPLLQTPLPKLPLAPTLRAHWLVIDGKQPATPDNPVPESSQLGNLMSDQEPSTSNDQTPPLLRNLAKKVRKTAQVQVKTTTSHAICLEQQVLFTEIIEAIMGNDEQKRIEALNTLQNDCGLQLLLPSFSIAILEGVRCNIAQLNLALLIYHMRMLQALSQNKNLALDRVLHYLLPAMLSCILSRRVGKPNVDNHWPLREFASRLLYNICKTSANSNTQVRVIQALSGVFTKGNSSMTTMCAAVVALKDFGKEVINSTVVPIAEQLTIAVQKVIDEDSPKEEVPAALKLRDLLAVTCMKINA